MNDKFQMSSMGELTFFLGLQVQQKQDGIFISQDKYVDEILKKFNYTDVKSATTPVDLEKPLVKDGDANDVDVYLYRSMIGSLMYLTVSRPDIMFAVCACARFQVTPKTSHLLAVKRIFRYLKGKPTLGLWYSRDSPFELVAYTDSDYAGETQDRKSTTGGYLLTKGFDAGRFQYLVSNLGEAAYILGIKIIRDGSKWLIALSQSAYLEKILKRFWMENSKKGYTPMIEKPDYRKNTKDVVLVYGAKPEAELKVSCYVDASFQTDKDDTKSQTGYVFILNGGDVDWKSTKQSTTAMTSTEAEYIAATEASMEAVWMRKFIDGLGGVVPSNKRPMEMLCDNEPAIAITNDPSILKGARHFQWKYHYIREVIQEREIVLKKVHTDDNVADPFTKPMPYDKHYEHAMAIGIVPARSLM
ncbi:retrotransposon protein, putative, ty1-copia subclass [Tanacetum coccineum]